MTEKSYLKALINLTITRVTSHKELNALIQHNQDFYRASTLEDLEDIVDTIKSKKGKNNFTITEAEEIKRLIIEKLGSNKEEQKKIRKRIRQIGFYFENYYTRTQKYDVESFNALIEKGKIIIT